MRLNSHQFFWYYGPSEYGWMTERIGLLKRDFLPGDLKPFLDEIHFDSFVAVHARQNLEEKRWLLELAEKHDFINGVVGRVDLRFPNLPGQLVGFAKNSKFVGMRHLLHDEPDDEFTPKPDLQNGLAELQPFGMTRDPLAKLGDSHKDVQFGQGRRGPEEHHLARRAARRGARGRSFGILSPVRNDD